MTKNGTWFFKEIERGIPERNPREMEFFRLTSPGEAVVREFIQNSLDASRNDERIRVRISFHTINRKNIRVFLDDTLKSHLNACRLLEDKEYPENILCLILEDFGTTGLDGPWDSDTGDGNFYNFWWREGISKKTGQKAGRWGLGKITFHLVSKIRTFWGLTVRDDGQTLLMGKALLRTHTLENKRYHYFGYFCSNDYLPVRDDSTISLFNTNFGITRNTETGLSVAVPFPVEKINFDSVTKGVIHHYYYPILAGSLKVEIHDESRQEELNSNNLIEKASDIDWNGTELEGFNIREILGFIKDSLNTQHVDLEINDPYNPEINQTSFGDQLDEIKGGFLDGKPRKFKVPIQIKKKNSNQPEETYVTVSLKRFSDLKKPFESYIRSGVLISEIRLLGKRPVAGLFVADDPVVSEFLGDCETPAHTYWNERTEGFAEKYENAARVLRFIKKSMSQIVSVLDEPPHERQVDFLKEIFFIPASPEDIEEERESTQRPVIPLIMGKPPVFNISKISGGFHATLNTQSTLPQFPFKAIVQMAYDTRRGNPFAQYEKFDFDVAGLSTNISCQDCNVLSRSLNKLEIEVTGQNFELRVTGFDPNRDLVVNIKEKGEGL